MHMIKFIFRNVLSFAKGYFFRLKLDFQMNFFTACSLTRFSLSEFFFFFFFVNFQKSERGFTEKKNMISEVQKKMTFRTYDVVQKGIGYR